MWRSSQGLMRKLTVKEGSGVVVSVKQRQMSTVMSFGYGWYGALGLPTVGVGEDPNAYEPTPIPSLPSDIVSVHVGHSHSLALTSQGKLWAWGRNEAGQLGRGLSDRKSWSQPKRVEGLENVNVCKIHNFVIEQVSFGFGHALAQTVDGKLFRWGGYLDIDNETGERKWLTIWEPHLVEELRGIQVIDIACGRDHSLILCCDGVLLCCGDGDNWYNQLGRRPREDSRLFDSRLLPIEMSFRPISIAAGMDHSLAICQLNESNGANLGTTNVASWGLNCHSQLGRSRHWDIPSLIDALDGENPILVSAGRTHSLALTSKGEMWVWGNGLEGRLGFDSPNKQQEPHYLDSLEGFQILQAVSGYDHNLVLVAS